LQPAFSLTSETNTAVSYICRLVEGLPLAIELAAGALPQHTPAEVAAQIQHNLDVLATKMRDMPARHRSMQATFEYSWSLLTDEEQRFFQQLSVFRGGFSVEAAAAVTTSGGEVSSETLLSRLVTKSLLHSDGHHDGRYRLHELLRHYAAEKLAASSQLETAVQERHGRYYVNLLQDLHDDLSGLNMVAATAVVGGEIENVRQAWRLAVERQDETAVAQALNSLYAFYATRCWYEEGDEMLAQAAAMLAALPESAERQLLKAKIWARQAKLCEITTFTGKAEQLYRESLAIFQAQGAEGEAGLPLQGLGYLAYMQGDNGQARQYLEASLAAFEQANQPAGTAAALNTLAQVARRQGEFQEASEVCRQGLEIRKSLGDLKGLASSLNILGLILAETGDFDEALASLQESVAICRQLDNRNGLSNALANLVQVAFQLGDQAAAWRYAEEGLAVYRELGDYWGVAISLNNLGCLAEDQAELRQARVLFQESVAIYREVGIRSGLATSLGNLGDVCVQLEKYEEAESCLREGLRVAVGAKDMPNTLLALSGIGYLLLAAGDDGRALPLLAFVQEHPKNRPLTKKKAARRLAQILPGLTAGQQAQIQTQSRSLILDDLVQEFLM
jgi:tetratricopeptide (TPR) repeat protein